MPIESVNSFFKPPAATVPATPRLSAEQQTAQRKTAKIYNEALEEQGKCKNQVQAIEKQIPDAKQKIEELKAQLTDLEKVEVEAKSRRDEALTRFKEDQEDLFEPPLNGTLPPLSLLDFT